MSAHFPVVALAAALAAIPTIVRGSEEEWRWRVFESGNGLGLYILESDEVATDALGAHRFHCRPGSGRIQAENVMGPTERELFANLISRNEEPTVKGAGAEQNTVIALVQPSYSEMDGWTYTYDFAADSKTFDEFKMTGTLRVRIGDRPMEITWTAGLDAVARFQAACRKR